MTTVTEVWVVIEEQTNSTSYLAPRSKWKPIKALLLNEGYPDAELKLRHLHEPYRCSSDRVYPYDQVKEAMEHARRLNRIKCKIA